MYSVHSRKEGCTQENRKNVQYSVPVKRIGVHRLYKGKRRVVLRKERVVHRKEVLHRGQEGCTRENRRVVSPS